MLGSYIVPIIGSIVMVLDLWSWYCFDDVSYGSSAVDVEAKSYSYVCLYS